MKIIRWFLFGLMLFLVFSAGFVSQLPTSFVLKQFDIEALPGLVVEQPKGTIWSGQVSVNYQGVKFDQLAWQLNVQDLLFGVVKQSIPLSIHLRHQHDQLDINLVASPKTLSVSVPQGQMDIGRLAQPFVQQQFMLRGLEGQLHFRDVQLSTSYNAFWPSALSGRIALIDLAMMGAQVQQLNIEALMQEQFVVLNIDAEQDGWNLNGTSQLSPPNQFNNNFVLTTQQPNQFPDWALMTMQQTSPTEARARMRGQW